MSTIKERIAEEFKRSPVTVLATVAGVVIALLALLVAWLQFAGQPVGTPSPVPQGASGEIRLSNLLVAIAFFLAASFTLASLVHFLERSHPFHAMVFSIPAAVLSAFFTLLVVKLVPPRTLTIELFDRATDLVFWGTLFVFVAINGRSTARDFVESATKPKSPIPSDGAAQEHDNGLGVLMLLLAMLAIWGSLVSAGLSKLSQLFLA